MLHGAIGSSAQLKPLADALVSNGFDPKLFDFSGHGGCQLPNAPFSIELFAGQVINWMDDHRIGEIDIFGYSMGGYVGLYLAKHHPERVGRMMTVATKLAWDIPTSQKEVKMLDPEKIAEKIPKFAEVLKQRHAPADWKEVLARTAQMMLKMGENPPMKETDFHAINTTVRMCMGDRDTMVSLEETIAVYRMLQKGSLVVLPATPHPLEQMNVALLADQVDWFFNTRNNAQ